MADSPYAPPSAPIGDKVQRLDPPSQVKVAIALFWVVLVVQFVNAIWQVLADAEAKSDPQFQFIWLGVTLTSTALRALFIYQASLRRNWARIALFVWTVGSWALGIIWPPPLADYPAWALAVSGTLIAMEVVALVLLFRGASVRWYTVRGGEPYAL